MLPLSIVVVRYGVLLLQFIWVFFDISEDLSGYAFGAERAKNDPKHAVWRLKSGIFRA